MQKADQLRTEIATISEMLKTGRADRALKRAVKAGKKWPKMPAFPQMAGLACIHQGEFKQAQTHLERAWKMEPENPDLIQNFGLSLVQGGDAGKALTLMNKVGAKAPLTPPQRYVRAMALLQERQLSEALVDVDEVLRHQNGNLQAHCLKADILDEMHQWNQAIDVLLAVAEKQPKFHYGQLRLAKGLVGLGRMSEALTHGRAAFALAPEAPETLEFAATLQNLSA
ncbi:tetratricopeptide repeat protein [Ruegeria profundi]|uniref:tetratricopeptide repeat protein n=1 Tax=Ruegeria profundi TaxID=1685378 RepID=UPI003C7CC0C4